MNKADANRDLLKRIYELFFSGDIETMSGLFAPDAVIVEVASLPYAGEYRGPEGMTEIARRLHETWDELALDLQDILASDTRAAGVGIFSAVAKATGERVSFPMAEIWTFEGGKILRCEPIYGDTAAVRRATGMT